RNRLESPSLPPTHRSRIFSASSIAAAACRQRPLSTSVSPPHQSRRSLHPMGKGFRNRPRVELSASYFRRRLPQAFHLWQNQFFAGETESPGRGGIVGRPASALPSTTANQKPEIPFPRQPAGRTFSTRRGLFPSPPRFHSTSARP